MVLPGMPFLTGVERVPTFSLVHTASAYPALGATTTHNLGSLSVGPASSYRHAILLLEGHNGSTGGIDFTGATCNSNAMTPLFAPVHGGGAGESKAVAGYIIELSAGTTATFSATSSDNLTASYALFSMISGNPTPSATATDTDTTLSQSLTIPTGGAAVGIAGGNRTSIGTATWTNMASKVLDTGINANNGVTAALHTVVGSATRSVSWSGGALSFGAMGLVAFEPI